MPGGSVEGNGDRMLQTLAGVDAGVVLLCDDETNLHTPPHFDLRLQSGFAGNPSQVARTALTLQAP